MRMRLAYGTTIAALSLAACGGGASDAPVNTYSDSVAHSKIAEDGSIVTTLKSSDDRNVLANAKWSQETGAFSIALTGSSKTVTGSLSSKASVEQLNTLVHERWQATQHAQPDATNAATLSLAEEEALFDPSRDDVTPAFDADGHQIGLANTSYGIVRDPQRGFLAFDHGEHVLWGWSPRVVALRKSVSRRHTPRAQSGSPDRTIVCWYLNVPTGSGIIHIEDCFIVD